MDAGWDVYSKLVLQQLDDLNTSVKDLRTEIHDMKNKLAEVKGQQLSVQDIKAWKERVDEVASPAQMKEMKKEFEDLKTFKTKAVAVFAFVQFLMAVALLYSKIVS